MELVIKFAARHAPAIVEAVTAAGFGDAEAFLLSSWTCLVPEDERDYAHINHNQFFRLDLGQRTLAIKGERNALWSEGGWIMRLLTEILANGASIVHYRTSDPRLTWDETLASYLETRAPINEWVAETRDPYYLPKRFLALREILKHMDQGKTAAWLNAAYTSTDVGLALAVWVKRGNPIPASFAARTGP